MKLKHLPHSIALATALLSAQHACAEGAFLWQDTSLSYLYGSNFQRMNNNAEEQRSQSTFTLENASGWTWGDTFFFLDYIDADNSQARGSNFGNLKVKEKSSFYYMEFSPRGEHLWLSARDDNKVLIIGTERFDPVGEIAAASPSGIFFTSRAARIGF